MGPEDGSGVDAAAAPVESSAVESTTAAPTSAPSATESSSATPPASSLDAAVLGLEAAGLKLDQPLPEDQVVRFGSKSKGEGDTEPAADAASATAPATASTSPPTAPGAEEADADADALTLTDAELAGAPKVLRQRFDKIKAINARLKEQVAQTQPAAQQFEQLQTFMTSNELDARSAANALRIAALVQGALNGRVDPSAVVGELTQWADQLRGLAGDALPVDVQKRLDDGAIDEATAKELARLRAQGFTAARRAELDSQAQRTQTVGAHAALVRSAILTWEQAVRVRDPDYSRKAALVESKARELRLERYGDGLPPSIADATALVQQAYAFANEQVKAWQPQRQAVRAPLNGATPSKSTMRAEPKSSLEAAVQGLERMGS